MVRRYSVTVPDIVGRVIDNMATHEGSKPTAAAAFLLETAVKKALKAGDLPTAWAETDSGLTVQGEAGDLALEILRSLITGTELDPSAIAIAAKHLNVAPHELQEKLNGGMKNGDRDLPRSTAGRTI